MSKQTEKKEEIFLIEYSTPYSNSWGTQYRRLQKPSLAKLKLFLELSTLCLRVSGRTHVSLYRKSKTTRDKTAILNTPEAERLLHYILK